MRHTLFSQIADNLWSSNSRNQNFLSHSPKSSQLHCTMELQIGPSWRSLNGHGWVDTHAWHMSTEDDTQAFPRYQLPQACNYTWYHLLFISSSEYLILCGIPNKSTCWWNARLTKWGGFTGKMVGRKKWKRGGGSAFCEPPKKVKKKKSKKRNKYNC